MKNALQILTVVGAALLASWATAMFMQSKSSPATKTPLPSMNETAYERIARTGIVRCAYATWPPYMVADANSGELSGVAYDQFEQVARYLELDVEWVEEVGYGNFIEGLNSGRYDVMCATVWPDGPRILNTTLTIPGLYSTMYAFTRIGESNRYQSFGDLNQSSVTIVAVDGDATHSTAENRFPKAKIHALTQISEGSEVLLAVMSGKADIALVDEGVFKDFEKFNPDKLEKISHLGPVGVFSESYAVPQGEYQLKNMIDTALIYLNNSGITEQILSRYEGSLYPPAPTFVEDW